MTVLGQGLGARSDKFNRDDRTRSGRGQWLSEFSKGVLALKVV